MDDASPAKWHLAHTTWFFEEIVLKAFAPDYRIFDPRFGYCFNSYYESLGPRHPRPMRGLLTRPSASEVAAYRAHVSEAMERLIESGLPDEAAALVEIGINHEQQHQELMLTDILALFSANPLRPAFLARARDEQPSHPGDMSFVDFAGGLHDAGHNGGGFAYDNEEPRHRILLQDFALANRPITNADWLTFIEAGGYETPSLWLSDGLATVAREGWQAPLYWEKRDDAWWQMTLNGLLPLDPDRPVCHISYYEADAFARFADARLPTEFEWEIASRSAPFRADIFDFDELRPRIEPGGSLRQMFGGVWEWTASPYSPYPGYRTVPGPLGEYNGKFMCNQFVLRGGSCVTPNGHIRATYRNFFHPHQRWQFMGLRLARDV
jgi:ergothioneine biosynthesis protein EgtB